MKEIEINDLKYQLVKDVNEGFDYDVLKDKATDYFNDFDYIIGDWAYGKLRLKGFYNSKNKNCRNINNINELDNYIEKRCAYGCRWFQIEKLKIEKN